MICQKTPTTKGDSAIIDQLHFYQQLEHDDGPWQDAVTDENIPLAHLLLLLLGLMHLEKGGQTL